MTNLGFNEIADLRLLLSIEGIGPARIFSLLRHFNSFGEIYSSSFADLSRAASLNSVLCRRIYESHTLRERARSELEKESEKLQRLGGQIITFWDDTYPDILRRIYYPPLLLYILGELYQENEQSISIVGTRNPTQYGKVMAEKFARDLVGEGLTIVSGLARGIDSIAHSAAMKSGGRTVAVIGSGLDVIYPPENKKLFNLVAETGCVVSEFPLGTQPDAPNFPKRNRIISGLSIGTLVVETKVNGGAIQTAVHALNQNREVFALPGPVNSPQSEGTNLLIQRSGAKLTTCAEDILCELNLKKNLREKTQILTGIEFNLFEQKIIDHLSHEARHIDAISAETSLSTAECLAHLLQLEFKGAVKQLPGKMFIKLV